MFLAREKKAGAVVIQRPLNQNDKCTAKYVLFHEIRESDCNNEFKRRFLPCIQFAFHCIFNHNRDNKKRFNFADTQKCQNPCVCAKVSKYIFN